MDRNGKTLFFDQKYIIFFILFYKKIQIDKSDFICKQLIGDRFIKVSPMLESEIPFDDPNQIQNLVEISKKMDLFPVFKWINHHFYGNSQFSDEKENTEGEEVAKMEIQTETQNEIQIESNHTVTINEKVLIQTNSDVFPPGKDVPQENSIEKNLEEKK